MVDVAIVMLVTRGGAHQILKGPEARPSVLKGRPD